MTHHNFELIREEQVPEFNSLARLYRHEKTGAELLSLINDDENKCFGISFRTPPQDSTGVAHILEHSVLCGSRKYPLKEPFIELAKGSLKTFLNAFTYPDKTCYPVASTNLQDFYNLVDVYLDSVFYPNLTPYTLAQEGWHYEIEDPQAPLEYKGVVFNEMKGNYSSPDSVLGEFTQQALYPDNEYGVDSGGDPKAIPDLTFGQLSEFHRRFYHPSNARIFFYGDDDPEKRLQLLDEWLRDFEKIEPNSDVHFQPRWDAPRRAEKTYAAGDEDESKGYVTVSWLLDEPSSTDEALARQMLGYILLSTPASPLRKALIDSGLGENVTGGLGDYLRQPHFTAGLKGINPDDGDKVGALILDTLHSLATEGIDPEMTEAAVNTIEFHLRENNSGGFPRGLALMLWSLDTWLHDKDPIEPLRFEAPLQNLKARLQNGERVFEEMIARELLENSHRSTIILRPDADLAQQTEAEEKARLQQARDAMSDDDIARLIEETKELKRRQETPDSPEVLALIPGLKLEDLDKQNKVTPKEEKSLGGVPVLHHPLFTNGVIYADIGFSLHGVPQELLPYVSLFGRALTQIGTEKEDFVRLTQRIGQKTGGVWAQSVISAKRDQPDAAAWLFLRGKAVPERAQEMLDIWRDVLLTVQLDNQERFKQMALEEKARLESSLVPSGHGYVSTRLRAHFSEAGRLNETLGGVSYLFFLRELCEAIDNNWPQVLAAMESLRTHWLNKGAAIGNVTADETLYDEFAPRFHAFLGELPQCDPVPAAWDLPVPPQGEGLTIPAQVNYVGKGANLFELGYARHGSAAVISNYLNTTWMWERVRMRGGAYGGFCGFDQLTGVWTYGSYRDPNLLETLKVYDGTPEFLHEAEISDIELTRSIIGVISDMDFYRLPDAKGWSSLMRYLIGETDERRQQLRDEVLSTSAKDFQRLAEVLEGVAHGGHVVVMGSENAINEANEAKPGLLDVTKVL
jgi:presequence protease